MGTSNPESTGEPDISFINTVSRTKKYIEVKSVREKLKGKNKSINYEVTRLKPFDDGETGNKNFDYLVIAYIHPSMGKIYRSMTHEECVRAIELKIFKFRPDWKGYAFNIDDYDNFTHTELKMYKDLECIKHHEQQTVFSLWGTKIDMRWLKKDSVPVNKPKNMLDIDNKQATIKDVINFNTSIQERRDMSIGNKMRQPPRAEEISLEQFMSYDENPIQRPTRVRAKIAKKKHLKTFKAPHAVIMVGEYPNKERVLIDGHTRRECIRDEHFPPADVPKTFLANIFSINDSDEAEELYHYFDNKLSVELASDKNYSVMKGLGYEFKSEKFQKPTDLGAVPQLCCEGVKNGDTSGFMKLRKELIELDRYDMPKGTQKGVGKILTAPVIAASLQLINRGYDVKDFLMKIRNDGGIKSGSKKCGIQHFVDWYTTTKEKTSGAGGYPNVAEKAIACFDLYCADRMQVQCPKLTKTMEKKYMKIKKAQVSS